MATEKHPHIESATVEQLTELLSDRSETVRDVYLKVHGLILDALPDVAWSTDKVDGATGYGIRQYGYGGWGMAALMAHSKWASLVFMQGAHLPDPAGLLEGTGANVRHAKLRSLEQFDERAEALRRLVQEAPTLGGR